MTLRIPYDILGWLSVEDRQNLWQLALRFRCMKLRFPQDVRGWLTLREANKLLQEATAKTVFEIGTFCGRSAITMAQSAKHVRCIDPFLVCATTFCDGEHVYDEFVRNTIRYGVGDKIGVHIGKVQDVAHLLLREFQFGFIDGAHDEGSVLFDISVAEKILLPGSRLAFHDYSQHWPEVVRAVDSWRGDRAFTVVDDLIVFQL